MESPLERPPLSTPSRRDVALYPLIYTALLFFVLLALYELRKPPAAVNANAPAIDFASGRAMQHLKVIAANTHPIGSDAAAGVRDYILKQLGDLQLTPEIQDAVLASKFQTRVVATRAQNILVRLAGQEPSSKSVMLVAHYDSVPQSPGASDDGSGVVTLIETLRALKAGPPLKNDVVALFTDGEEVGLTGASLFVNEHSWAKNVGVVLNFEARGSSGPVFMFETSDQNGWLIKEFGKAAPYPFASSFMYTIYKLLPNDTDLSTFKRAGMSGLNFAYLDDVQNYHTQHDSLNAIDERSVQHDGSYALSLTRHFGNLNLENPRAADAIYFDLLGSTLISYPTTWAIPLAVLTVLLFAGIMIWGIRSRRLTILGLLLGFFIQILSAAISIGLVTLIWGGVTTLHPDFSTRSNANLFMAAFVILTISITTALYLVAGRWTSVSNLTTGTLLVWLVLAIATSFYLPVISYLALWPLLFSLAILAFTLIKEKSEWPSVTWFVLFFVCSLPGLILWAPTIYNVFQGLGLRLFFLQITTVALLLGLLVPSLRLLPARRWLLPISALLLSLIFLIAGNVVPAHGNSDPRSDTLVYSLDTNSGEAVWASSNARTDQWTTQFLSSSPRREVLTDRLPNNKTMFLVNNAPSLGIENDRLEVLDDIVNDGIRTLRLKLISPRKARIMSVFVDPQTEVLSATVGGKRIETAGAANQSNPENWWELTYRAVPKEGFDLTLETKQLAQIKVKLTSQSDGLPEIPNARFQARPAHLIPAANSDVVILTQALTLGNVVVTPIGLKK
jgi:hypothetical protein